MSSPSPSQTSSGASLNSFVAFFIALAIQLPALAWWTGIVVSDDEPGWWPVGAAVFTVVTLVAGVVAARRFAHPTGGDRMAD